VGHDHSSPWIESHGHRSRSKVNRSVCPRSSIEDRFYRRQKKLSLLKFKFRDFVHEFIIFSINNFSELSNGQPCASATKCAIVRAPERFRDMTDHWLYLSLKSLAFVKPEASPSCRRLTWTRPPPLLPGDISLIDEDPASLRESTSVGIKLAASLRLYQSGCCGSCWNLPISLPMFLWLVTLTFCPQNKWVSRTFVQHLCVKFNDLNCIGFWDIVRKNSIDRHRRKPTTAMSVGVCKYVWCYSKCTKTRHFERKTRIFGAELCLLPSP